MLVARNWVLLILGRWRIRWAGARLYHSLMIFFLFQFLGFCVLVFFIRCNAESIQRGFECMSLGQFGVKAYGSVYRSQIRAGDPSARRASMDMRSSSASLLNGLYVCVCGCWVCRAKNSCLTKSGALVGSESTLPSVLTK